MSSIIGKPSPSSLASSVQSSQSSQATEETHKVAIAHATGHPLDPAELKAHVLQSSFAAANIITAALPPSVFVTDTTIGGAKSFAAQLDYMSMSGNSSIDLLSEFLKLSMESTEGDLSFSNLADTLKSKMFKGALNNLDLEGDQAYQQLSELNSLNIGQQSDMKIDAMSTGGQGGAKVSKEEGRDRLFRLGQMLSLGKDNTLTGVDGQRTGTISTTGADSVVGDNASHSSRQMEIIAEEQAAVAALINSLAEGQASLSQLLKAPH